jgi:AcrR family transcriptional regulator
VGASAAPRRLRADAARNRQRLIEAARQVFAERGMDATLDDIAHQAGVNVATAYRHFANKHELARSVLQATMDQVAAITEDAAKADDPWNALTNCLEQTIDLIASNRGALELFTRTYGAEWREEQLHAPLTNHMQRLVRRAQQAGVLRPDVYPTDFALLVSMLGFVADGATPELGRRYLSLIFAGLRASDPPLPGLPPTDAQLRAFPSKTRQASFQVLHTKTSRPPQDAS